jgi:glycosyltransferase involved in cell wall biosynthesis
MPERLPISALLLARDESAALASLLPALAFAAETIVVVDADSRDDTAVVAARAGARVFTRALDGFGAQRQFALARCSAPWVLWIDTDERLDGAALSALRARLGSGTAEESGFTLDRHGYFLGRRIRHCGWQGESVLRIFRRERARFDDAVVHERVLVEGRVGRLAGALEHHSYPDWADCVRKLTAYARAGAREARRAGRRAGPLDVILRPPGRFLRMYLLQLGFLDGFHGLLLCALAAAQVFLKYAELWSMRHDAAPREAR